MKTCPHCHKTYTDETLNFCLDDGEWLVSEPGAVATGTVSEDGPPTAILMSETPTRIHGTGAATDKTSPATAENRASNKNYLLFGVVGVLLIASIGFGGYWLFENRTGKQINSIAVMPFVNESGNPDLEYLSNGMTDTLIRNLLPLPNLNVKAHSSVFRYKGKDTDAKTIGNELGVQAILNGRVIQRGDQLSLNLELIDAATENVIWTDRYDRKLSDIVSLQNEIARDVSQKLSIKLSGADQQKLAKNYTSNPEAYKLYLQGKFYWEKRTRTNIEKAIEFYQQAIEKDPNYTLAYAGLAEAYAQPSQQPEGLPKARAAAQKALSLDPDLTEAHVVLGRLLATFDYDFSGAERELRHALELNPNYADAHCRYGSLLSRLGRFETAEAELHRSLELEPLSLACNVYYGNVLINERRYDDALNHLKKTLELDENFFLTHGSLANVYQIMGNYAESVKERARVAEINGNDQDAARMRASFEKHGWVGFLRSLTEEAGQESRGFYSRAKAYAALGEKDNAFAALNKAYEAREIDIPSIKVDPLLDPLRDDPRFKELLKKVGFPE